MQQAFNTFLKKITIYAVVLAALQYILSIQIPDAYVSNAWPVVILFFFAFTVLMHRFLLKSTEGRPQKFIFSFMMITTIKILLYLGIILVYVLVNKPDAVAFIGVFFLNYFLFTGFEISSVMKFLEKPKA
jgi:hypothetical protein